jgi:hypothetical protein
MLLPFLTFFIHSALAAPCDLVGVTDIVTDLGNVTSCGAACGQKKPGVAQAEPSKKEAAAYRGRGPYHLLGQDFGSLQELHDWLVQQSQDPASTVRLEPELRITLTPGAVIHQRETTIWTYYNPDQKLVIDGNGAVVSGLNEGHPTPGYFLSYRPIVGTGTTRTAPAPANFEMTGVIVRGYESGGLELNPITTAGASRWEAGMSAFIAGAVISGNTFEQLGSLETPYSQTSWKKQRYGNGGVLLRGVSASTICKNVFEGLENGEVKGSDDGSQLIHAVYVRDSSSYNLISGNTFEDISGDPVRISNDSDHNVVNGNTSRNAGQKAFVSEWYSAGSGEQPCDDHRISGNDIGKLYRPDGSTEKAKKAKKFHKKRKSSGREYVEG